MTANVRGTFKKQESVITHLFTGMLVGEDSRWHFHECGNDD